MMETKTEKVLRKIILGCVFLTLLLPLLIVNNSFLPFIFPKAIVFRVLVEIMLICYLTLLFSNFKKYKPPMTGVVITITVFFLVMILATIFSASPYVSFWGTLERMEGLLAFFHFWLFFIIITVLLKERKDWFNLFNFSVAVGLLMDVYSVLQRLGWSVLVGSSPEDRERAVGTIGNPAFLAAYLLLNCILVLILMTKTSQRWLRIAYWLTFLFNLVVIYLTNTRGAILAIGVALFLFAVLHIISFPRRRLNIFLIGAFLLLVAGFGFLYANKEKPWIADDPSLGRLANISFNDESTKSRLMAWEIGWQAFKERPLLGWGPENYNIPYNKYFKSEFLLNFNYTVWYDRAHNIIVELASTMGFLGLTSYLAIFIYIFIKLFKRWRQKREYYERLPIIILTTGLIAYFLQNIFIFDTINSYLLIFIIFAYISYMLFEEKGFIGEKVEEAKEELTAKKIKVWLVPVIILVLAIPFIKTIIHPVLANHSGFLGKVYFDAKQPDKGIEYYKDCFRYNTFIQSEILDHAADGVGDALDIDGIDDEKKISYLELVIDQGKKMLDRHNMDVKRYINLSKNYARLATYKDKEFNLGMAIQYLEKGLPLSPKRQRLLNDLAFAYLRLGNSTEAINILDEIIRDNPNIPEFYWNMFLAQEEVGDKEKALAALEKAVELGYPFAPNIAATSHAIDFYESLGQYEKTPSLYKLLIAKDSKNVKWYMRLAATYAKLGNKEAATMWAYRILEINPIYQEEVKNFILSLEKIK